MRLLQAARAGDRDAFERIVERYQATICAITFSGAGRLDVSEELAQETFLHAWANLHQLRDLAGFRSWLYSIARHTLSNYHRRKQPASLDAKSAELAADGSQGPPEILIQQEEYLMLEQAIMGLPPKYREPLVLFCRQQQSTRQVAEVLGLTEATVRTRLHRARSLLREQVAERLERVLGQTGPREDFTKAVMLAVGTVPMAMAATAKAAASASGHAVAAKTIPAVLSSTAVKIAVTATVIAVGALSYVHWARDGAAPSGPEGLTATAAESAIASVPSPANTEPELSNETPSPDPVDHVAGPDVSDPEFGEANQRGSKGGGPVDALEADTLTTIVTGTVLDRNVLSPIVGARIGFESGPATITDAQGRFRLSWGGSREEVWIWATASGYASQRIALRVNAGNDQDVSLRLQPGLKLTGVVVDPNHQPITNVKAKVISNVFAYPAATTNDRGEFEITGLNPEVALVHVVADHVEYERESATVIQVGRLDEPTRVEFVLAPKAPETALADQPTEAQSESAAPETAPQIRSRISTAAVGPDKIHGCVVDAETGEPLPRFHIVRGSFAGAGPLMTIFNYAFASTDGEFDTGRWPLQAGSPTSLTAYAEGYDPLTLEVTPSPAVSDDPVGVVFSLRRNERRSRIYAGRVVDELGQPIEGAEVGFRVGSYLADRGFSRVMTDAAGNYMISSVDPCDQIALVRAPGYAPHHCYLCDLLLDASGVFADVVLVPAATVSGYVWDELGQPITDTRMIWSPVVYSEEDALLHSAFQDILWPGTRTNEAGYYELAGVAVGDIQIGVLFDDHRRIASRQVTLHPGDVVQLNFGDRGGLVVSGVVTDGIDMLVQVEVQLKPLDADAKSYFGRTDAAGQFKLIDVPPGKYVFAAFLSLPAGEPARDSNDTGHVLYKVMEIQSDLDLVVDYQTRSVSEVALVP